MKMKNERTPLPRGEYNVKIDRVTTYQPNGRPNDRGLLIRYRTEDGGYLTDIFTLAHDNAHFVSDDRQRIRNVLLSIGHTEKIEGWDFSPMLGCETRAKIDIDTNGFNYIVEYNQNEVTK